MNTKTGKAYNDLRKALSRGLKAAGVTRHIRFHDLRHTAASHLVMAGVDLRTVGAILGHKDPKVTQRYAHLAPEHLKEAMEKLDYGSDTKAATDGGQRENG
jgi:site-specific recombinase XerD